MSLGIQTSVHVGEHAFTVETEVRAGDQHLMDTTVYAQGRVLYRRVKSFRDLLAGGGEHVDAKLVRERLEAQHRGVLQDLRTGTLKFELPEEQMPAPMAASRGTIEFPGGIEVKLINSGAWLKAGVASLEIGVLGRTSLMPVAGATVEVSIEGAEAPLRVQAGTDARGRVALTFPMPKLGEIGGELVIAASSAGGQDEVRYRLKPKARTAADETPGDAPVGFAGGRK